MAIKILKKDLEMISTKRRDVIIKEGSEVEVNDANESVYGGMFHSIKHIRTSGVEYYAVISTKHLSKYVN